MTLDLSFFEMLQLATVFTPAGMDQLKTVVDGAKDRGRDGVRAAVYQAYPWAEKVLAVALDKDPEGAYQYILQLADEMPAPFGGANGKAAVTLCRAEIYQIHGWLQGEMDRPRSGLLSVPPAVVGG